jgi:hypothetical protein
MNKRNEADMDLFEANAAVQRRSRILARQERIQLLEQFLACADGELKHRALWVEEVARCKAEIAAEGRDQP